MTTIERDPATLSRIEALLQGIPEADRGWAITELLSTYTAAQREDLKYAWRQWWARPNQLLPSDPSWDTLFIRAGRGYGKTRTGAESVRTLVTDGLCRAVTIIGSTAADGRDVMIENPDSGLLAVHPPHVRPTYKSSNRTVEWPNGAIGHVRSAEEPDGIRGLNSDLVWGDEPASWKSGRMAWDNAMLGNRVGRHPRSILTGTPRPLAWLKEIEAQPGTHLRTGSTYENIANLAPSFIELILRRYENTRLGLQELHAQYLADVEGAYWRMSVIEGSRIGGTDPQGRQLRWNPADPWASLTAMLDTDHRRGMGLGDYAPAKGERRRWEIWVGVDPPGETAECGIIVGTAPERGRAGRDHAVILDDMSLAGPPEVWGARVVEAIHKWGAVGAVVEKNQGGDMVRSTIHAVDPNVKVEKISAQGTKGDRAEPVSVLYPKDEVHHYGHLAALETMMTTWVENPPEGEKKQKSPDRIDALVHLVTKLLAPSRVGKSSVGNPANPRGG